MQYRNYCSFTSFSRSTSSVTLTGNKIVTNVSVDKENNEYETVNIPLLPNNDVEFDISEIQVTLSSADKEEYYTINS